MYLKSKYSHKRFQKSKILRTFESIL